MSPSAEDVFHPSIHISQACYLAKAFESTNILSIIHLYIIYLCVLYCFAILETPILLSQIATHSV